ncbi:MAG: nucleotidyltransferase domain-containing protein [Chloroflexota bacterium]
MNDPFERLKNLCQEYPVQALYVFGSREQEMIALQQGTPLSESASDVDVALLTSEPFSIHEKVDFALALEEILDVPRVDLVILNDADPFLAANAIRGYRLYARDSYLADEYELFVLRRAGDLAEFERQRMALILQEA